MASSLTPPLPPWEKVLFKKQPYDDSYVDKQKFLDNTRKNASVVAFEYWSCVRESAAITQQCCLVVLFLVVFEHLRVGQLSLQCLMIFDALLFLAWMVCCHCLGSGAIELNQVARTARIVALFITMLLLVSPVIHTLTYTYSGDTIWAMAITLLVIHLFSADYNFINGATDKDTGVIAINAATFSSVLLASRLPSAFHAFSILTFSIILFGLSPVLRHLLKKNTIEGFVATTWLFFAIVLATLASFLQLYLILFVCCITCVSFVFPKILINMQQSWKMQISGPWDEAKPPLTASSKQWQNAS